MTRNNDIDATPRSDQTAVVEPRPAPPAGVRRDRVRWGPVWAGALTVVATFLVLRLLFFAFGWLDLAVTPPSAVAENVISGLLALVAFLVGGVITAATLPRPSSRSDGVVNGVLVWALTLTIFLVAGVVGAGALIGPLGEFTAQGVGGLTGAEVATVRTTAGWVTLGFVLALLMVCLGGGLGAWKKPGGRETESGR